MANQVLNTVSRIILCGMGLTGIYYDVDFAVLVLVVALIPKITIVRG